MVIAYQFVRYAIKHFTGGWEKFRQLFCEGLFGDEIKLKNLNRCLVILGFDGTNILQHLKGVLLSLRQFLASENSLKIMKNDFYLTLKSLLALKISKFLSWVFCHIEKQIQ